MKLTYSLILIALFAVGCNRNQSTVASAADAVESADERDPLDMMADYPDGAEDSADETVAETTDDPTEAATDELADETTDRTTETAETEPEPEPEPEIAEPIEPSWADQPAQSLAAAVKDIGGFGDRAVVPLAHFRSGPRDVVIAWPVYNSAGELSPTAYGVCVELLDDDSYTNCGDTWIVSETTSATDPLERALGTSDFEVLDEESTFSLDTLAERLPRLGNSFVNAATLGDSEALFEAARAFVQTIPVVDRTFNTSVPELLVSAARGGRVFRHVKTEVGELHASITFKVREDLTDMTTFDLTAARADTTSSNEWNIIDYW